MTELKIVGVRQRICAYEMHAGNVYRLVGDPWLEDVVVGIRVDERSGDYTDYYLGPGEMFLILVRPEEQPTSTFVELEFLVLGPTGIRGLLQLTRFYAAQQMFEFATEE